MSFPLPLSLMGGGNTGFCPLQLIRPASMAFWSGLVAIGSAGLTAVMLLLDTHLVLWWLNDDPRLPATVVEQVQAPGAEVLVSQASLWEMAIKVSIGRLRVDLPELERQVPMQGFRWLPVNNAHLLAVAELENDGEHRDPFDRLLVCQSRVEPLLLLTVDSQLWPYGTTVIVLGSRACLAARIDLHGHPS
ncbi:MAG: type II toxin-antitoxin system VapC family toxin [Synechococcaceae cyanobacterium]